MNNIHHKLSESNVPCCLYCCLCYLVWPTVKKNKNIQVEEQADPQIVKVTTSKDGILLDNQINKLRLKPLTWWAGCHLDFIFSSQHQTWPITLHVISLFGTLRVCWSSLRVDYERIKAVGPDRAASEWLLRCGAKVRFQGFERWHHDYNGLPTGPLGRYKIQGIDATESCIMYKGFDHLGRCYSVQNTLFLSLWTVPRSFPFPSMWSWIKHD